MSEQVYVTTLPDCDLCKQQGKQVTAHFDAKTVMGPWGYLCNVCFGAYGVGLGDGRGQRLLVRGQEEEQYTGDRITGGLEDLLD